MNPEIPEVEPQINRNALSVYNDGAPEDFPVLKAFQQYIDAEQEKARKRVLSMGIFFGVFTLVVIAVFVALLMRSSERNQALNDKILEFVMRERSAQAAPTSSPVVVQPPQDNSAILALTGKLDEMQKKLAESQAKAEKIAQEAAEKAEKAAAEAAKPKGPTAQELEIERLKTLLDQQKKDAEKAKQEAAAKAAAEKEAKRQAELEEYRRKHYPELYAPKKTVSRPARVPPKRRNVEPVDDEDDDLDAADDGFKPISYFDEEDDDVDDEELEPVRPVRKPVKKAQPAPPAAKKSPTPAVSRESGAREWSLPEE